MPTRSNQPAMVLLLACVATPALPVPAGPAPCHAASGVTVPTVVELYTSEGCSSCPPADRWLSSLAAQPDLVRLAFHVDYWDRLGWKDRFADPAHTQRQQELGARGLTRFVYTPQIVVDGADYRSWPGRPSGTGRPATVQVSLGQDGSGYLARFVRGPGAPMRLTAFWAITEDGLVSQVRAGENRGTTMHHDAVVREYLAVPVVGDAALRFEPRMPVGSPGARRHVVIVVSDASTGRPVQAVGC